MADIVLLTVFVLLEWWLIGIAPPWVLIVLLTAALAWIIFGPGDYS